jgi:ABC-type proline/glycine betaine transport system ATPase subunit
MMEAGQIVASGTPQELLSAPEESRVAAFLAQSRN